jgi:nucleotide-binding universal stress UspA family protein
MKTIVIPTDFSPVASNAMYYGVDLAKSIKGSVLLLHVYNIPISYSDVPVALVSVEELRKAAEEKLAIVKKGIDEYTWGSVRIYTEARLGNIVDEMEDLCNKIQPFAVVMGSKGSSGLDRVLFGSTTLTAVRHLKWPVISVPPEKKFGGGIKKIGFACDFKDIVKTTPTHYIKNVVYAFNAELHVLNVDHNDRHFTAETPEQSALLHTMLEEAKPVYHFINYKDIEDGINDFADKNHIDLIITIPKKHKLLESLFRTSSTKQLIYQSHVPVMCVHE